MEVKILRSTPLPLRSLSGVEVIEGILYMIADDASVLYKIKHNLEIIAKVPLFDSELQEHIPKKSKADLECFTKININQYPHFITFGSGSLEGLRDRAFLVKLPTPYNRKFMVWPIEAKEWYRFIRMNEKVTRSGAINLEGLCATAERILFFNRNNTEGSQSCVLDFDKKEFIEFIQGHTEGIPFPNVSPIEMPILGKLPMGITGADYFDEKIFVTLSAEDSPDAIQDGEVLGSAIGIVSSKDTLVQRYVEKHYTLESHALLMDENGQPLKTKIESVSIFEKVEEGLYTAVAVSDEDGSASMLYLLEIKI